MQNAYQFIGSANFIKLVKNSLLLENCLFLLLSYYMHGRRQQRAGGCGPLLDFHTWYRYSK